MPSGLRICQVSILAGLTRTMLSHEENRYGGSLRSGIGHHFISVRRSRTKGGGEMVPRADHPHHDPACLVLEHCCN